MVFIPVACMLYSCSVIICVGRTGSFNPVLQSWAHYGIQNTNWSVIISREIVDRDSEGQQKTTGMVRKQEPS